MHKDCPVCGATIVGESYEIDKKLAAHIKMEHEQGYRRTDSWRDCPYCSGRGKDVYGISCRYCNGSGKA